MDAARQPLLVNDSAGPLGPLGPPGPVISLGCLTWGYPHGSGNGAGPLGSPALPDPRSISLPGISSLPEAQPSLSRVRPPPGFTGTPRSPGNFQGQGKCQPSGRHHPSTGKWKWAGPAGPIEHFPSGYLSPARRELGHPRDSPAPLWGPGNFQGRGKRQPSGRHRPSTLVELGRCPTGQRPP